jgi:hypothetical protein
LHPPFQNKQFRLSHCTCAMLCFRTKKEYNPAGTRIQDNIRCSEFSEIFSVFLDKRVANLKYTGSVLELWANTRVHNVSRWWPLLHMQFCVQDELTSCW